MKTACTQACNFLVFFLFSKGGKRLIRDRFFLIFWGGVGGGRTGGIKRVTPLVYDDALSS